MLTKTLKAFTLLALIAAAPGIAHAAVGCQIRAINFVGVTSYGGLVIGGEMWNDANAKLGTFGNVTFCDVDAIYNGIDPQTCRAWHATATAAMLAGKKIYITANSCPVGVGGTLSGLSIFGLVP